MTAVTQCPECGTSFKITGAQIDAHNGLVRCGHCRVVFHARDPVADDKSSPQLNLPIEFEPPLEIHTVLKDETELNSTYATEPSSPDLQPIPNIPELGEKPKTLAQQIEFIEELTDEVFPKTTRKPIWKSALVALLLTVTLVAQAAYFFRVEIAARLPGLKPLLTNYCALFACTIGLPQDIQLLVIESSELESNPEVSNIVTLHALLHNRAAYAQAYPSLELTLTNLQDNAVARRIFKPTDYLKPDAESYQGIAANRDLEISLHLDTSDLKPAGYRLFLFYPQ